MGTTRLWLVLASNIGSEWVVQFLNCDVVVCTLDGLPFSLKWQAGAWLYMVIDLSILGVNGIAKTNAGERIFKEGKLIQSHNFLVSAERCDPITQFASFKAYSAA